MEIIGNKDLTYLYAAGDIDNDSYIYDITQSFVGGGLSGLLGKNINKKIAGEPKTFWDKWYGKGISFGNENVAKSFAFDDKDEFFKKPWYVHAGTWGAGFANGAWVGAFDANKGDLFEDIDIENKFGQAGIELGVRGVGFGVEYAGTVYAKSEYGKKPMNRDGDTFLKKLRNTSPKNLGYLLITYMK